MKVPMRRSAVRIYSFETRFRTLGAMEMRATEASISLAGIYGSIS